MVSTNQSVRPLVAGNWKMNGIASALDEVDRLKAGLAERSGRIGADVLLCPPATLISAMAARAAGSPVGVGGQDCHPKSAGAHTGDISAEMLKDAGAVAVIVGHSERRADHGETDSLVKAKAEAALRANLTPIVCVGETADQRKAGRTIEVVAGQLEASLPDGAQAGRVVVAYEPVWAIGSGLTPTAGDVGEVHAMMRDALTRRFGPAGKGIRLLYGGSVKASNARELMGVTHVNGALVGGASLKAADFLGIIDAYC